MNRFRVSFAFSILLAAACAFAQRAPIPQQLTFTPYHANGIYKIGETVGWTVTPGPVAPTYAYKWTIRRNNAVVLKEGKLDLSSGHDKIEIPGDQPEMIYVAIEPYAALPAASPTPAATAVHQLRQQPNHHTAGRRNHRRGPGCLINPEPNHPSPGAGLDRRQHRPQQRPLRSRRGCCAHSNPSLHSPPSGLRPILGRQARPAGRHPHPSRAHSRHH